MPLPPRVLCEFQLSPTRQPPAVTGRGHLLGDQWMPAAFSRWVTNVLAALLYFWV